MTYEPADDFTTWWTERSSFFERQHQAQAAAMSAALCRMYVTELQALVAAQMPAPTADELERWFAMDEKQ